MGYEEFNPNVDRLSLKSKYMGTAAWFNIIQLQYLLTSSPIAYEASHIVIKTVQPAQTSTTRI